MVHETLTTPPPHNCVLATNTSLVEGSRLLAEGDATVPDRAVRRRYRQPDETTPTIQRLAEFCSIVEAAVLHDSIFTLPSRDPDDISSTSLISILRKAGICKELPSVEVSQDAIDSLQ
jgi:hypothetical protein